MGSNRLVRGVNDFATLLPEAAAEWDYEKNNGLRPDDIMAGSDRYIYFRCARGHEWRTKAYHRKEGHGCPVCTSVEGSIVSGINDLASNRPELILEWDSGKNCYDPGKLVDLSERPFLAGKRPPPGYPWAGMPLLFRTEDAPGI